MSEELIMYSTTWCGYCKRLSSRLLAEGIPFRVVNIEEDEAAAHFVENVNGGNQTVPTVRFTDGSVLTNPAFDLVRLKYTELLAGE